MRLAVIAFAAGAWLLQRQAELPGAAALAAMAIAMALLAALARSVPMAQASAAALGLLLVYFGTGSSAISPLKEPTETAVTQEALASLLAAMLVAFLLGGFEIATSLHLRGPLGFGSGKVAGLFIACGAGMALTQLVLLPRVPARASRVAWALVLVAASGAALAAMPLARTYAATLALGTPLGGALGLAFGLLGLEMAAAAGGRRGLALGAQNAAITAGQAAGSVLGGMLFAALGERALPAFGAAGVVLALSLAAARPKLQSSGLLRRFDPAR